MRNILIYLFGFMTIVYGASFDCTKATTNVEKMICENEELSQLDIELSEVFKAFYFSSNEIKNAQKIWLKERDKCQNKECIQLMYQSKIQELKETNITDFPKLTNVTSECSETLQFARINFQSTRDNFSKFPQIQEDFSSELVLYAAGDNISSEDEIIADPNTFRKIQYKRFNDNQGNIYWQINENNGHRLVITEHPMGWRGDMYSVFDIPANIKSEDFILEFQKSETFKNGVKIVSDSWKVPLIFKNKDFSLWMVVIPQPFAIYENWQVYLSTPLGMKPQCDVVLKPNVKSNIELLPKDVQKFALLLDKTMGSGKDEGTLQPTAQLRTEVEFLSGNIALRPWIVFKEPYNSHQEVEDGLINWSKDSISNQRLYESIRNQFSIAEKSLAQYYQQQFNLSSIKAETLSKSVIDIFIRSHYSFSKNR
jgi:uncharacterized protein